MSAPQRSAAETWQALCDPGRYRLPHTAPDPVMGATAPPPWWDGYLDEDGDPDPGYVASVEDNPADRSWSSTTARAPLTLYQGSSTWDRTPDTTTLATAEVGLVQDVDHREPFVNVWRRSYYRERDATERQDIRQVFTLRLSEAEELARVLLAAVKLGRDAVGGQG